MNPTVHRLPYGEDPLKRLAEHLLQHHAGALPHTHVVLPTTAHERLRACLLAAAERHGHPALLGPHLHDLPGLVRHFTPPSGPTLGAGARELLLVDALRQHPDLFNRANPWALAESLAHLFDELTLATTPLEDDEGTLQQRLEHAYGTQSLHLEREARLIHTLWQAYRRQLQHEGQLDDTGDYARRLTRLPERIPDDIPLLLLADPRWHGAERRAVAALLRRRHSTLFIIGERHDTRPGQPEAAVSRLLADLLPHPPPPAEAPAGPTGRLLHACYQIHPEPLAQRARQLKDTLPRSPLSGHTAILQARDVEQQARAAALQLCDWHHQGLRHLGVVTEDRRLARRLRALLERHGLTLRDRSGWALSTSAAASAIERLLQCLEEDYPHQALLDLLKSPFFAPEDPDARKQHSAQVHRLERDIIQRENIARGLQRYLRALDAREQRAEHPLNYQALRRLLQRLEQHTRALRTLTRGGEHPAAHHIDTLRTTLARLEMEEKLARDPAGARLLEELDDLAQAARRQPLRLHWHEFRAWLGRTLERYNFIPPGPGDVTLLNFAHSSHHRFDALVICGLDRRHRPGHRDTPFFNRRVRLELGLGDPDAPQDLALHQFRVLLEAAPRLLLTSAPEDPETPDPDPWLERLQRFHHHAYGDDLHPHTLAHWAARPYPAHPGPPPPAPPEGPPCPRPRHLPRSLGAYAHQRLIDCPYRFHAGEILRLAAPEPVRETLAKNDYGNLVHRCLQAFHSGLPGLPGPYRGPWDEAHTQDATALLERISQAVFEPELRDHFAHRDWLQRWRRRIPHYIRWQIQRARHWRIHRSEQRSEIPLPELPLTLTGRIDRIDHDGHRQALIDYKTGTPPRKDDVAQGEDIQLIHYALLAPQTSEALYLHLDHRDNGGEPGIRETVHLDEDQLNPLRNAVEQRLNAIFHTLQRGDSGLPAWSEENTCRHCPYPGLCRRAQWAD